LVDFIKYGVLLAVIVLCQRKAKDRKTVFLSSLLILSGTLALLSQGGRVFLVYIVVPSAVLFHYLRRRIRLVELVSAALIMFLVLGLFGYLRSSGKSQSAPLFESVRRISSFPEGQFWDGVAFGYGTLTLSYEVFFRLTQDLQNMQHPSGGFLFYSLHRFIPRESLGGIAADLYSGELTTATFLGELYGDYQYWGVLLGSLLMGFGYGWAYSRERSGNRMYWIYVRALLVQMLIFFPYVNFFSIYVNWIFDLFFMYLLIRHLSAHGDRPLRPVAGPNAPAYLPA
jgi:oligosaccharide repeat unit polymerase